MAIRTARRLGRGVRAGLVGALLLAAAGVRAADAPAPLRLELKVNPDTVLASPPARLDDDGVPEITASVTSKARPTVQPTNLTLTLTNTSRQRLRLNVQDFRLRRLLMEINGPPEAGVVALPAPLEAAPHAPVPTDLVLLEPGARWTSTELIPFPGPISDRLYVLTAPGDYTLRATYASVLSPAERAQFGPEGTYQGAVSSAPVTLHVRPGGAPVDGLELALAATPAVWGPNQDLTFTVMLHNANEVPLLFQAWGRQPLVLVVRSATGQQLATMALNGDIAARDDTTEDTLTIAPGATYTTTCAAHFDSSTRVGVSAAGTLRLPATATGQRGVELRGDSLRLEAQVVVPGPRVTGPDERGKVWRGRVVSAAIPVLLDATTLRSAWLKEHLNTLHLALVAQGTVNPPLPPWDAQVGNGTPGLPAAPTVLSAGEGTALLTWLASSGALGACVVVPATGELPADLPPGYALHLTIGPGEPSLLLPLPLGAASGTRLGQLQQALPERARAALAPVLTRLAPQVQAAAQARVLDALVSLQVDAPTLTAALAQVAAALHLPAVPVRLDPPGGQVRIGPVTFQDVPAGDVVRHLATLAGRSCDLEEDGLVLRRNDQ